jgi:hypothetical protein
MASAPAPVVPADGYLHNLDTRQLSHWLSNHHHHKPIAVAATNMILLDT